MSENWFKAYFGVSYEQQLNILKANLAECKKELKAKEELLENFMLDSGKIH